MPPFHRVIKLKNDASLAARIVGLRIALRTALPIDRRITRCVVAAR
jgi:hypothetical protein